MSGPERRHSRLFRSFELSFEKEIQKIGGLSPFKRGLKDLRGLRAVVVLHVLLTFILDFFKLFLKPGSTVHCIDGFFPPQNSGQNPGQKPGQKPGQQN